MSASAQTSIEPIDEPVPHARPATAGPNDWLFVTPRESRGWILDAICREIGSRQTGSWDVAYNPKVLPQAGTYFFAHYWNYLDHLKRNPHIEAARTLVWYTHPREIPYSIDEQVAAYNRASCMVFTCTEYRDLWVGRGVQPERAVVVLGGADPDLFMGHARGTGCVGLSSSFYERKNPDALIDVVRALPHRHFRLIGRNWDQYGRFDELMAQPNFDYVQAPYADYPSHYATFDVFLSLAMLEGGPIPVLEAMMENIVPVASRTGFCPDLIVDGQNGFLFDIGAPAEQIAPLIEAAFALKADIRRTVQPFSWDHFAHHVHGLGLAVKPQPVPSVTHVTSAEATGTNAVTLAPPLSADVAQMAHADRIGTFVDGLPDRGETGLRQLAQALRRPWKIGARPVLIALAAQGPLDVLGTPCVGQIAAIDTIAPFVVIAVPNLVVARTMQAWAIDAGLDGLVQIDCLALSEIGRRYATSVARIIAHPGPALDTEAFAEVEARLTDSSSPAAQPVALATTGLSGAPVVQIDTTAIAAVEPRPVPISLEIIAGELIVGGASATGVVIADGACHDDGVLVRGLPQTGDAVLRLKVPVSFVRNHERSLHVQSAGSSADCPPPIPALIAPGDLTSRMLRVFMNRGGAGNPVMRAFADGLSCRLAYADDDLRADGVPVVWGVLRGSEEIVTRARADDRPFFYIDHAYFGRGHYSNYRITRNAYEAGPVRVCPTDRADTLGIELRPWRTDGGNIIVCPPTEYFMDAHGCPDWLEQTVSALYRATDRPVEVRLKPAPGEPSEPLSNVFSRAHAIVTHSSNVAVEAVVAGVPVFVSPTSAAAPVGEIDLSRIELPRRPDRQAWLSHLAYSQFAFDEIADGSAWRLLMENERREFAS